MTTNPDELRLLEILLEHGNITPAQKARVERTLSSGKDLVNALMATSVVDPLDLIRAKDYLRRSSSSVVPKLETTEPRSNTTNQEGMTRDEDGVQVVDWGELEVRRTPMPVEPEEDSGGGMPAVLTAGIVATDHLIQIRQATSNEAALTHDVTTDEGIGLVRRVNRLIVGAMDAGHQAIQIAWSRESALIAEYDLHGRRICEHAEEAPLADKIAAHLQVLARISPWKDEHQMGGFTLLKNGRSHLATVVSGHEAHQRKVTLFIAGQ